LAPGSVPRLSSGGQRPVRALLPTPVAGASPADTGSGGDAPPGPAPGPGRQLLLPLAQGSRAAHPFQPARRVGVHAQRSHAELARVSAGLAHGRLARTSALVGGPRLRQPAGPGHAGSGAPPDILGLVGSGVRPRLAGWTPPDGRHANSAGGALWMLAKLVKSQPRLEPGRPRPGLRSGFGPGVERPPARAGAIAALPTPTAGFAPAVGYAGLPGGLSGLSRSLREPDSRGAVRALSRRPGLPRVRDVRGRDPPGPGTARGPTRGRTLLVGYLRPGLGERLQLGALAGPRGPRAAAQPAAPRPGAGLARAGGGLPGLDIGGARPPGLTAGGSRWRMAGGSGCRGRHGAIPAPAHGSPRRRRSRRVFCQPAALSPRSARPAGGRLASLGSNLSSGRRVVRVGRGRPALFRDSLQPQLSRGCALPCSSGDESAGAPRHRDEGGAVAGCPLQLAYAPRPPPGRRL